jgi:CubicO group peptidase (beta-lactamase class C family)
MKKNILSLIYCLYSMASLAQVARDSELYKTLKTQDSLLFEVGFNHCDMRIFDNLISEKFEFYHDKSGITPNKEAFLATIKNGLCQDKSNYQSRRELIENSVEVYTLENQGVIYGAIQKGKHRFYEKAKNQAERLASVAQFTHLWQLENGAWKLSRVLSFDHQSPEVSDNQVVKKEAGLFADDKLTEEWLIKNRVPALGLTYIREGKINFQKVYGVLDKSKPQPAPQNAIFNVASLTKPITALVALKLVDQGKWDLDEPLYKYWIDPDIASNPYHKKITTRLILSHQTGFPNWRKKKLDFKFEPGSKYQYSGEGFEYLRFALEHKFKKTLIELANELIFKPLQMKDARFIWDTTMDESRYARWHQGNGALYPLYRDTTVCSADDLLTTIEDYGKFMLHILQKANLSDKLWQDMITPQVKIKNNKFFGLGWAIDQNIGNQEFALMHGGDDQGVHTLAILLPKSQQGLLIFTNSDNGTDIYMPIILHFLGQLGQGIINVETK